MKSCELHLVPNCPLCKTQTSAVVSPVSQNPPSNPATITPVIPPPAAPPEPQITDPHAKKMMAAAEKYAAECEAVKTISEHVQNLVEVQLKHMQEMIQVSKEKLKEAQANRDAAQKEMMQLLGGKI